MGTFGFIFGFVGDPRLRLVAKSQCGCGFPIATTDCTKNKIDGPPSAAYNFCAERNFADENESFKETIRLSLAAQRLAKH